MSPAACFSRRCGLDETETADAQRLLHVRSTITALPRTRVMTVTSEQRGSECRSAVFEFMDDPGPFYLQQGQDKGCSTAHLEKTRSGEFQVYGATLVEIS